MELIEICNIWEPYNDIQPTKTPNHRFTFDPVYPVCFTRIRPQAYRRGWMWLWVCDDCGYEQIEVATYLTRCSCDKNFLSKKYLYPRIVKTTCSLCETEFTYTKTQKGTSILYCGSECSRIAQGLNNTERAERALTDKSRIFKQTRKFGSINDFDRGVICMKGKYNIACDHYSDCQNERIRGSFGNRYKLDGSCFTSWSTKDKQLLIDDW